MTTKKPKQDKARRQEIKRRLKDELKKELKPLILGTIAMIGSAAANQAVPKLLGRVLDQQAKTCPARTPSASTNPLLLVVLGGGLSSFLRTTMLNRAQDSIASRLRMQVFTKLMKRNIEWYQTPTLTSASASSSGSNDERKNGKSPAEIQSVLADDVNDVSETITTTVANIIRSCCSVIFATRNMMQINPHLLSISVGVVPVIGSAAVILNKFVKNIVKKQRDLSLQAEAFAAERVENVNMVKISSREEFEVEKYVMMQEKVVSLGKMASLAKGIFMGFMFSASSAALVMVFHAGGKDVSKGKLTHGELKSFATYTFMLGLGTSGVMKGIGKIMQGMVCADRVYNLLDDHDSSESAVADSSSDSKDEVHNINADDVSSISVSNLSFAYASNVEKTILKDVTLDIERGQVVILVGGNGAGKSSLANVLVALHKPKSGSIIANSLTGDVDFMSLDRKEQSSLVQLVPQQPAFFDMSINENVIYTNPSASKDSIEKALEASNCTSFISKLESGLDYNVGRNGSKLSGGQRQRLALARALLSNPALLILDEPNSSMDAEGESAIADIARVCRDGNADGVKRGLLLISHRVSSLHLADKIVVMKDGEIVESGSFNELSKDRNSELCELMPDLQ
jgi:ABC-type multidrug transport system fused ATPase/permease subunit